MAEKKDLVVYDDFYSDLRWCPNCNKRVRYLRSDGKSYCVECGNLVKCFTDEELADIDESLRRDFGRARRTKFPIFKPDADDDAEPP